MRRTCLISIYIACVAALLGLAGSARASSHAWHKQPLRQIEDAGVTLKQPQTRQLQQPIKSHPAPTNLAADAQVVPGGGWQKVMSQGFEQDFAELPWTRGDHSSFDDGLYLWGRRDCKPHSGSYSLWAGGERLDGPSPACTSTYANYLDITMRSEPVDLSQVTDAELSFGLWLDVESQTDAVDWSASADGTIFSGGFSSSGQTSNWVPAHLDLADLSDGSSLIGQAQVYFLWGFYSNQSNPRPYRGAFIDDVAVWVYSPPPQTPPPTAPTPPITYHSSQADFAGGQSSDGGAAAVEFGDGAISPVAQLGTLSGWERLPGLPHELWNFRAVAAQGHLLVIGGNRFGGVQRQVYSARIGANGILDRWVETTPLPQALVAHAVASTGNRLFVIGGFNANGIQAIVFSAPVNADGTVGIWQKLTPLPKPLMFHEAVVAGGYLYVIGGKNADTPVVIVDQIYRAAIRGDGSLGAWEKLPDPLPLATQLSAAVVACNSLYVIGGATATYEHDAVFQAPINPDGSLGTWEHVASLPKTLIDHRAIATHGGIMVVGGLSSDGGTAAQAAVYWAPLDAGCTPGAWISQPELPYPAAFAALAATDRYLYSLGGMNDPNWRSSSVHMLALRPGDRPVSQGSFAHQFYLGHDYLIKSLQWKVSGSGSPPRLRYRTAGANGIYGSWSNATITSPITVGAIGSYLEYEVSFDSPGFDQHLEEISVTISSAGLPSFTNLPMQILKVSQVRKQALDLWDFASDESTPAQNLIFAIAAVSDEQAGVSLSENRYINLHPVTGWTGEARVTLQATNPDGLSTTALLIVEVQPNRGYLPLIMS